MLLQLSIAFLLSSISDSVDISKTSEDTCNPLEGIVTGCSASPVVQTQNGPVRGFNREKNNPYEDNDTGGVEVSTFWGIPFAEPPVGMYRLRAPQPLQRNWSQMFDATKRSPRCLQSLLNQRSLQQNLADRYDSTQLSQKQGEDCLYLNVYTPTTSIGRKKLPVMVWIYGGGYTVGDAYEVILGQSAYDGAALAGRFEVVIVTMNYRLNGLGFFAADELRAEDPDNSTGNMAVRDQRAAMQWVKDNIDNFGGDSGNVTLFGESAGGFSVIWHLVSELSWPLFHKAIVESGTSKLSWFFQPYEGHSQEFYAQWSEKIGCPRSGSEQLDCLRKVDARVLVDPPADITVASPAYDPTSRRASFPFGPTIDFARSGLRGVPLELATKGHFNKVPLIIGACKDGGTLFELMVTSFVPGMKPPFVGNKQQLLAGLNWTFPASFIPNILKTYPDHEFTHGIHPVVDYDAMFSRMLRDVSFQCSNRGFADQWVANNIPVWLYTFSFNLGELDKLLRIGDLHGSDILFVWRHFLWLPKILPLDGNTKGMADLISCAWTSFAYAGNPNSASVDRCKSVLLKYPAWPQYSKDLRQYYSLTVPPTVRKIQAANSSPGAWPKDEFPSDVRCDMWESAPFPWHGINHIPPKSTGVYV